MNLKSWFVWFCLAVIAVSEVMLFRASQQKTEALDKLSAAQHEADQARKDLDDFKASAAAAAQNADTRQLRVENAKLSQAVTVLKNETNQLQQANVKLAQQLAAVGRTVQQQETQLQQWQTVSQQAQAAVQQSKSRATAEREACIANLKLIDAAKLQWALVNNKTENDIPTAQDLLPYFKDGAFPVCPAGGTYTINSVGQAPTCSIPGHALPLQ